MAWVFDNKAFARAEDILLLVWSSIRFLSLSSLTSARSSLIAWSLALFAARSFELVATKSLFCFARASQPLHFRLFGSAIVQRCRSFLECRWDVAQWIGVELYGIVLKLYGLALKCDYMGLS